MTTFTVRQGNPATSRADVVVVGVLSASQGPMLAPGAETIGAAWGRKSTSLLASMGMTGKPGESVRLPSAGTISSPMLQLVGLGDEVTPDGVRRAAGVAARNIGNAASVALALPATSIDLVSAAAEGFLSGGYRYKKSGDAVSEVALLTPLGRQSVAKQRVAEVRVVADLVNQVRDWINTPPNLLRPPDFATAVTAFIDDDTPAHVTYEVFDEIALGELGCGGILAVGRGSSAPPRLVKISYAPPTATTHVALVGKGITFDSGGLTIKPGQSMATMKLDMAGAASVVAAVLAIARLALPVRVTAFAPMAENLISGQAYRPGDVLTMRNGRTVEVTNTDAEGRLILADALALAVEESPAAILNLATLTGACVVALGDRIAGLFGDDEPVEEVLAAAATSGELMWRLPIPAQMTSAVREGSSVADLHQHNWVRWGSASFAAAFLHEFAGAIPFIHLDIAGPGYNSSAPWGDVPSGGTGFGVRTIVNWVRGRLDEGDEADTQ